MSLLVLIGIWLTVSLVVMGLLYAHGEREREMEDP